MRSAIPALAGIAVAVLLAGCTSGGIDLPVPTNIPSSAVPAPGSPAAGATAASGDPIGLWRVRQADGADDATWIRLDSDRGLVLWTGCGMLSGSWNGAGGNIITSMDPIAAGACGVAGSRPSVPWLNNATTVTRETDGTLVLGDTAGEPVATLAVDGTPPVGGDVAGSDRVPPVVTDEARQWLADPDPLPDGTTAATDIAGAWIVAGTVPGPDRPGVDFGSDGTFTAHDGCNSAWGRWRLGEEGQLLSIVISISLVQCFGIDVPTWVEHGARAAMIGDDLVLFDAGGMKLGVLERP